MKKRMTIMGVSLGIIFGGIILFHLVKSILIKQFFANYQPPAVAVASAVAQEVNWEPQLSAIGNFVAINGVDLSAEASGNVIKINFESGQYVNKDDSLVVIDDSVDQALLKFNQSELTLKTLNYQRQSDLFKKGATSSSSLDEAKANLQQAQAKLEQSQAQVNYKHISAPFAGRLGIRQVNLGQYVIPGQTAIVSLQSLDPLYLEFYLPEQSYKNIRLQQKITFTVDEFPDLLFEGTISAVNSKVDANTHNVLVQATLPNCPAAAMANPAQSPLLKISREARGTKSIISCNSDLNLNNKVQDFIFMPGMFAAIAIPQPAEPKTVIIPSTAISYSLYGNAVYLIEKDKAGQKNKDGAEILTVNRVFVATGDQEGNFTVIKKGIKPGQLVVRAGDVKLHDGTAVTINNEVALNDSDHAQRLGQ